MSCLNCQYSRIFKECTHGCKAKMIFELDNIKGEYLVCKRHKTGHELRVK